MVDGLWTMDRFGKSRCGEKLHRDFFILRIVGGQWTTWSIDNGQWSMESARNKHHKLPAAQTHMKPLSISYCLRSMDHMVDGQWSMASGQNKHHKLPAAQTHVKPPAISYCPTGHRPTVVRFFLIGTLQYPLPCKTFVPLTTDHRLSSTVH